MLSAQTGSGRLCFVGAKEPFEGSVVDRMLLEASFGDVLLLPTAAAFERPGRVVDRASAWFAANGGTPSVLPVFARSDAEDAVLVAEAESATLIYLLGGSPLHLRAVLKDSLLLTVLVTAWRNGATIVGCGSSASVLCDPMVDPRGGAFTVGLGFVRQCAVVPHFSGELTPQLRRTLALAPKDCAVVGVGQGVGVVRAEDGSWRREGDGPLVVYADGVAGGLELLAGKSVATGDS